MKEQGRAPGQPVSGGESHLSEEYQDILKQAQKPYGSVDERYLRDWLLAALEALEEAQGKLNEIERYGARLGKGHSLSTWQGLVKSDLDRILSKEGE